MSATEWKTLQKQLEGGGEEAIHETRKLSRKVEAELKLGKAPRKTRRAWKELRRAVAPVRDHDAAGQHLRTALERLNVPEAEQRAFDTGWKRERQTLLSELNLSDLPEWPEKPKKLKKKTRAALAKQSGRLRREAAEVLDSHDPLIWHSWRKALKQYRYTLEVLEPAPKILKQTLDALGRMQDAEVLLETVAQADWPYGHQPELMRQERAARSRARTRVRQLAPELCEYLKGAEERGDVK